MMHQFHRHYFAASILICIVTRALSFQLGLSSSGVSTRTRPAILDRFNSKTENLSKNGHGVRHRNEHVMQCATSESSLLDAPSTASPKDFVGNVVFILPHNANEVVSKFGSYSPYGSPSILEAAEQLVRKVHWFSDGLIGADIVQMPDAEDDSSNIQQQILDANAVVALNIDRARLNGFVGILIPIIQMYREEYIVEHIMMGHTI